MDYETKVINAICNYVYDGMGRVQHYFDVHNDYVRASNIVEIGRSDKPKAMKLIEEWREQLLNLDRLEACNAQDRQLEHEVYELQLYLEYRQQQKIKTHNWSKEGF